MLEILLPIITSFVIVLLSTPSFIKIAHIKHLFDVLALQAVLRSAKVAGNDRVVHVAGEALAISFRDVGKWTINKHVAFFVEQFWRHCR